MKYASKSLLSWLVILAFTLAAAAHMASAAPVNGKNLYHDSLTYNPADEIEELVIGGKWEAETSLTWDITDLGNGEWHYKYIWDASGRGNLSHFMLEVTDPSMASDFYELTNAALSSADPKIYIGGDNPNDEMLYDIYAIKFTAEDGQGWGSVDVTFEFTSTHSPTWGDFFARDGKGTFAYNKNFSDQGVGDDLNDGFHAAVPNGAPIPIPSAVWLLGGGLIGLVAIRRRKA